MLIWEARTVAQLEKSQKDDKRLQECLTMSTKHLFPLFRLFLSADEASEGRGYNVAAGAHRAPDRNHLLQSAWALRDPQGVLRRTLPSRSAVEPPPESRRPLPETGENLNDNIGPQQQLTVLEKTFRVRQRRFLPWGRRAKTTRVTSLTGRNWEAFRGRIWQHNSIINQ